MAKLISLFNHKGGVSKTTTTFSLGWAMADRGLRVLIVDGDPQCNLTGTVLGLFEEEDFERFYTDHPAANINSAIAPVFAGGATPLVPAQIMPTSNERLFLLAGHIDFAINETQLAVAISTGRAIPALQNLPGALNQVLRITAQHHEIDYVLVDMSPSVGAINECLLMGSDYFIVPTSPDYYCNQAIRSLSIILPRWNDDVVYFRNPAFVYRLPELPPRFLGIISQRYRPRSGNPAAAFQNWINRIKATVNDSLAPVLTDRNMIITAEEFMAHVRADTPYNLANISDFNTLVAQSQIHNTPAFALTNVQIERQGTVLENMIESRDRFAGVFRDLAESVSGLTA